MLERHFRIEFDTKSGSGLYWSDIMDVRKNKSDFEIIIQTPDGKQHSKFVRRRVLSKMLNLHIRMEIFDDLVEWGIKS